MKIVVASGKGGTGKTTVAVNLALSLSECTLVDCDVEEPNCSLFLPINLKKIEDVVTRTPKFNLSKCTYCGQCADFCEFHAIAVIKSKNLLFYENLCHGCGGCELICPNGAISEGVRKIGEIHHGTMDDIDLFVGKLDVGEPMATPVIKKVKSFALKESNKPIIFDSPPGVACPAIEAMRGADFCILVTEPTPFGLHDLKLAVGVTKKLGIPCGVIVNREGIGDDRIDRYCAIEKIPILMKIKENREIAELYSKGIPFTSKLLEYRRMFLNLYKSIDKMISDSKRVDKS
ncbi:MAG: ATP-binding protein [Methanomassiliicoccales archaeon]|nr:ATP-binding protein [Methanomassiliicoccales archaeon]